MSWGLAFLIVLCWIVGSWVLYALLDLLDKKYHFYSREGFAGLGRFLCRIIDTFVPAILFLCINLLIRMGKRFGGWYVISAFILLVFAVPLYGLLKMYLLSPKRIAVKARKTLGDFTAFKEEYRQEHANQREPLSDRELAEHYLWRQLNYLVKRQGNSYFFAPSSRRVAFAKAVIDNNRDVLTGLTRFDYFDDKKSGNGMDSRCRLYYEDGREESVRINRETILGILWIIFRQYPTFLVSSVCSLFYRFRRHKEDDGKGEHER